MDPALRRLAKAHITRGPLSTIIGAVAPMPLSDRKTLLTICRVQQDPATTKSLRASWSNIMDKEYFYDGPHCTNGWYSLHSVYGFFEGRWADPLWMGFLSMLLRTLPVRDEEAQAAFRESLEKEFEATQQTPRLQQLDYSFLYESRRRPVIPGRDIAFSAFNMIREGILAFRHRIEGEILYPRSSTKTTSSSTRTQFAMKMGEMAWLKERVSLLDLEKAYSRGEGQVDGYVEMRQAWKYNDLKPRTYFACGGTMYYPSRYIQSIMNALVDSFPSTDTFGRFSIERFVELSSDEIVILYDYTSFTSSMAEQKHFLFELAQSMKGVTVNLVDTRTGPTPRDLGDIIEEYNQSCNVMGEFTFGERLCMEGVFRHICASFLGIYGNISSCTALHGIVLGSTLSHPDGSSVIGDDAMARFMRSNMELAEFAENVSVLGNVHPEKYMEFFDERLEDEDTFQTFWHYAKRPVARIAGRMYQGSLVDWPLLPYLNTSNNAATSYHTVKNLSPQKNLKSFCMQAGRLMDSMRGETVDIESEELIRAYLEIGYRLWDLTFEGSIGHYIHKHKVWSLAYPCIDGTIGFEEDWVDHIARRGQGDIVELPVEWRGEEIPAWGCNDWITKMTPLLKLGVSMDWLSAKEVYEQVLLDEGTVDRYIDFIRRRPSSMYRFHVVGDVPDWMIDMYTVCIA